MFRTRCVSEWPDTVNFQSHLEYRQDYMVVVVVYMVMVLVLMVMVVDCGQGHLECRRAYISLLLFVCMVTESRHDCGEKHLEY